MSELTRSALPTAWWFRLLVRRFARILPYRKASLSAPNRQSKQPTKSNLKYDTERNGQESRTSEMSACLPKQSTDVARRWRKAPTLSCLFRTAGKGSPGFLEVESHSSQPCGLQKQIFFFFEVWCHSENWPAPRTNSIPCGLQGGLAENGFKVPMSCGLCEVDQSHRTK